MRVSIICDAEHTTALSVELRNTLLEKFKNDTVQDYGIKEDVLSHCLGCFGCWVRIPGECVISDLIGQINRTYMNSELVIFLSPIVFGGLSANIKNVLDRTLPNILPFFTTNNGVTSHKKRYHCYPKTLIIGYGDAVNEEQQTIFSEWLTAHSIGDKNYICLASQDINHILTDLDNL